MADSNRIRQVSLVLTSQAGVVVPAISASEDQRKLHSAIIQEAALDIHPNWPGNTHLRFCHSPLYVPPSHFDELEKLQAALSKALSSIIDRWWTDEAADFPNKMPINQHEENLLKWIAGPGCDLVPSFEDHQGCWRPDYLIESGEHTIDGPLEQIRICEINARFPYNGFLMSSFGSQAYTKLGNHDNFKFTVDPKEILATLISMFNTALPLHIVKDQWPGFDVHMLAGWFSEHTGQSATFITPSSLRLLQNSDSGTGYLLYRVLSPGEEENQSQETIVVNNEILERVYQVVLELLQPELEPLSQNLLRQLATCCVNDFRSTLLVHDKRMLGVVLSDLDKLVHGNILTPEEATTLARGITPTILPRSAGLRALLSDSEVNPALKNAYVLKAIRGGLGQGHIFGTDVDNDEWLSKLRGLRDANLSLEQNAYAVQRRILQLEYDIVRRGAESPEKFYLVPSYLSINGRYFGSGPWRLGRKVHVKMNDVENGIVTVALTRTAR